MKKVIHILLISAVIFACKTDKKETPSVEEQTVVVEDSGSEEEGWNVLFDGTSFDGWHAYGGAAIPEIWNLEDGAMLLRKTEARDGRGNRFNLVTDQEYTNFQLSIEWMVSSGANSGIMWAVVENEAYNEPYLTGPEIQVLDNIDHPDAKNGTSHRAGALYDMVSPSKDVSKPVGEWNHYLITVNHKLNEGSVVMNGELISEFPVHGEEWDKMVANSKFATWEAFGKSRTGKIALQDHGEPLVIGYRNIKIKEL